MDIREIEKKNQQYLIQEVTSDTFKTYGRVLQLDASEALDFVNNHCNTKKYEGTYVVSVPELEALDVCKQISLEVYGGLEATAGVVKGHNQVLNGLEYHNCSETIIAVEDFIYAIGHRWDMEGNTFDCSKAELFYVPKGTIIESYATTLHYTPIALSDAGNITICFLIKGTGNAIARNGILKKTNKWFIAHPENKAKVQDGDYPGLTGEMISIVY